MVYFGFIDNGFIAQGENMKKVSIILLCLLTLMTVNRQSALAATESDTETFLSTNFDLQSAYTRVLCVHQAAPCPGSINTAVPCLTIGCANVPQNYNIHSSYGTIQAASIAALPGDLIIILPGTYAGVQVEEKHGANNAYIHFLGWGTPGSVIVNSASAGSGNRHHFYFIDTNYYIIQNIAFQNASQGAGIFFSGYFNGTGHFSHHIIVLNVYSHDNYKWGLHTTQASYMVIQDSVFTGSTDEHGAYISGGGDHFLIRRNVFQGNNASGLQVNADPQTATLELFYYLNNFTNNTCGYTEAQVEFEGSATWQQIKACYDSQGLPDLGEFIDDGISQDLIIEQNVMTNNGTAGGGAINLASVRNSIVRNNVVYGNRAGSITCWDNNYAADKNLASSVFGCDNVRVVNNTVMETTGNRAAVVFTNDARNMTVYNNIIARGRSDAYEISERSGTGLRSGANYYYALELSNSPGYVTIDTSPSSGSVTGFSIAQALTNFVNPNTNNWVNLGGAWPQANPNRPDFRLKPTSALISLANPTYRPNTDFLGNVRVGNSIGALDVTDGSGGPIGLSAPTGASNAPYGNPNYVWNDNGADTYEFYLDNSANDGTAQYYVASLTDDQYCNGTTCTFDPVGLSETARLIDGGYVVYLRGTSNGMQGALAGPFTFSLDAPPPVPVTFNPPTGTTTLRPTFSWSLSGNAIYSIAFRLFLIKKALFDAGNYAATVDLWFSRTQVCGTTISTSCTIQSGLDLLDNTNYYLYIQSYGPGGYSVLGPQYNNGWAGVEFRVDLLPDPAIPTIQSVTLNQGRPSITFTTDANATRHNVVVYNWTTNAWVYNDMHEKINDGLTCSATTCTLLTDAMNFANGNYSVWVNAEGAGGASSGGMFGNGYGGPSLPANTGEAGDFVLNFLTPLLVTNLTATTNGTNVTINFTGVTGATWYYIWVGTENATQTYYFQWHSSTTLNCQNMGACSGVVTLPAAIASGSTYYLAVQSAGPGGYSVGGPVGNGFQVSGELTAP